MEERNPGAWEVIAPAPADAPGPPTTHYRLGKPCAIWTYRGAGGAVLGHVHRYDLPDGGKSFKFDHATYVDGLEIYCWAVFVTNEDGLIRASSVGGNIGNCNWILATGKRSPRMGRGRRPDAR